MKSTTIFKRIFAFIIALSTLSVCISSCNNNIDNTTTYETIIFRDEIDYNYRPLIWEEYITFEEMCENVTDVIIGNYLAEEEVYKFPNNGNYYDDAFCIRYVFDVKDAVIGDANGQIRIYTTTEEHGIEVDGGKSIFYRNLGDWFFEYEEDLLNDMLLLLIKCDPEKYNDDHAYEWIGAPEINLDKFPKAEYYNEPLSNHISGIDMDNCTREEFIEYVCSLVKNQKQN